MRSRLDELTSAADVDVVNIPVLHELGWDLTSRRIETTRLIPPSRRPVAVKVVSDVVTHGAQRARSADYLATLRRRNAGKISRAVTGLAEHVQRPDFAECTYPVLKELNELLSLLADAEVEGNTRGILRQIRNTLMNGGWDKYRAAAARSTVAQLLNHLAEAAEVLPHKVDEAFAQLQHAGLNPVGAPIPEMAEEADADAENEVPD